MRRRPLAWHRDQLVQHIIHEEVARYLEEQLGHGAIERDCAYCGAGFEPKNRWHFCCSGECRKAYYRGQFHPREAKLVLVRPAGRRPYFRRRRAA